ncbi:MAG: LuxR C-terminal-related transcriptional regulator [Myxococcaceae bacterium]|jgi:DNA-binding CsgD family transcriptional regulator|nr:LuxR C-terminal-related transcriptional regulator [Myxococcaceae bacterium]
MTRWLDLLDALYDLEAPEARWLSCVADAASRAFTSGDGAAAYRYSLAHEAEVGPIAGTREIASLPMMVHDEMPLEAVRLAYGMTPRALPVSWAWATPQGPRLPKRFASALAGLELADGYAIIAPMGLEGLAIGLGMPRRRFTRAGTTSIDAANRRWTAIAAHASTALALRTAHAAGSVVDLGARAERQAGPLADVLKALESRRTTSPHDASALEAWAGLLSGRFSIVRTRLDGGRLTWLAVENPHAEALRSLTPAERVLVERASTGAALKHVALDLGLAETTVATTLGRALQKLGLRSRAELVTLASGLRAKAPARLDSATPAR